MATADFHAIICMCTDFATDTKLSRVNMVVPYSVEIVFIFYLIFTVSV